MKLEDLVIHLKIEEDNRNAEKKSRKSSTIIGVNIVEEAPTKDKNRKKSNEQKSEQAKKKFKGNCYNCGKAGHRSSDCHAPRKDKNKGKGKSQANIVEKMEDADDLCAMISECNLVGNPRSGFSTQVLLDIFALQKKPLQRTLLLSTMKIYSWETQQQQGLQELGK